MTSANGHGVLPTATTPNLPSSPSAPATPLLEARSVTLQYKTRYRLGTAIYRVSFDVYPGDRFIVLGPSGRGKSSLLKSVGGYLPPVEGSFTLAGAPVRGPGPDRMMVFQEFDQLFAWKTVLQNVAFPLVVTRKCSAREANERALLYLSKVNRTGFKDSYPHTLSGGMKQRVAIARAMAMEPAILLMDEPFAALDALTRRRMQDELLELWSNTNFTMLFVTHSIEEAILVGSRILLLSQHPGQVRAELNCGQFEHADQSGEAFASLQRRIHRMVFDELRTEGSHA